MLMQGKAHIRTDHKGQSDEYLPIYILSLTWELDGVEWSRHASLTQNVSGGSFLCFTRPAYVVLISP
jgi:hypothetical protein